MSDKARLGADVPTSSTELAEEEKPAPILNTQNVEVVGPDGTVHHFRHEGAKVVVERLQQQPAPEVQPATPTEHEPARTPAAIGPTRASARSTTSKAGQASGKLTMPGAHVVDGQRGGSKGQVKVAISRPQGPQCGTPLPDVTIVARPVRRTREPTAVPTTDPKVDK